MGRNPFMSTGSTRDFYDYSLLVIQVMTLFAVAVTACIYYRQLKVMSSQLKELQDSNQAENSLRIVELLQNNEVRESRKVVRGIPSDKNYGEWTEQEKIHASHVAANYDVVAALLKSGLGSPELIAKNWKSSIVHCHKILGPHIDAHRNGENGDPGYWSNFDWLLEQAKKSRK